MFEVSLPGDLVKQHSPTGDFDLLIIEWHWNLR